MSLISFRDLVGVAYTEGETKALAAEVKVVDGPNDEGEMFTRPGKLSDRFPQPYPNEQAARFANGLYYNPHFPGGVISMPKMLQYGAVEYEDGTPPFESQAMAKDITELLAWAAEPEMEERKLVRKNEYRSVPVAVDGIQMDFPVVTCTYSSCLLPAVKVVCSEVPQGSPGCCQLISSYPQETIGDSQCYLPK
ncbi:hypothetical protein RHGRI_028406 [Rhododendron griersonianum]|uniref:Uncharacterized protein n=1 Tax=Rhododendron griersonianum TaxID=479676 RepID=A0AAV6II37_9ERIC|nr:hypothetical protein RHGRI_028406 [Rhododendron griersonianum]